MRFGLTLRLVGFAAVLSACGPAVRQPTPTPTVTSTPAVIVEVTHFPTSTGADSQTEAPTLTLTPPPTQAAKSTSGPIVITPAPPPSSTAQSTVVPGTFIQYFRAEPAEISPGDPFTLSWKVITGNVVLWRVQPTGQLGTSENEPLEGSKQIQTSTSERNFVQYMLYVQSGSLSETQFVTIKLRCLDTWFMDNPPTDCPATSASITQGVYQPFQGGFMIWIQSSIQISKLIYVLYSDANSPRWSFFGDLWQPGMPEQDDTLTPPAGLFQPVRGFGKVWREEPGVKDRLGWALAAESAFQTAFQCNSAYKYTTCYIKGPTGVIVLQPESSGWAIWTGPTPPP